MISVSSDAERGGNFSELYALDAKHPAGKRIFISSMRQTGYQSLNSDSGVLSHDDASLGSIQVSHLIGTSEVTSSALASNFAWTTPTPA